MNSLRFTREVTSKSIIAFSVLLYLIHFFFIIWLAPDVPIDDEWNIFQVGRREFFEPGVFWSFIIAPHGQHYLVTTRIISWLAYHLTSFDYSLIIIFDFVLYGIEVWLIAWVVKQYLNILPIWLLAFFPFLLSARTFENHLMSVQNQFQLVLIFFLVCTYLVFNPKRNVTLRIVGATLTIVTIFTFTSGVAACLGLALSCALAVIIDQRRQNKALLSLQSIKDFAPTIIIFVNVAIWAYLFKQNAPDLNTTASPMSLSFWDFYLNLISSAFGYHWVSWVWGLVLLSLIVTPLVLNAHRVTPVDNELFWFCFTVVLGTCAALAMVALGRSEGVPASVAKTSRYSEIGQLFIPFALIGWHLFLKSHNRIFKRIVIAFWAIWFFGSFGSAGYVGPMGKSGFLNGFKDKTIEASLVGIAQSSFWNFNRIYQDYRAQRIHGLECASIYYSNPESYDTITCLDLYALNYNHKQILDRVKELNLSFVQKLTAQIQARRYYKHLLRESANNSNKPS